MASKSFYDTNHDGILSGFEQARYENDNIGYPTYSTPDYASELYERKLLKRDGVDTSAFDFMYDFDDDFDDDDDDYSDDDFDNEDDDDFDDDFDDEDDDDDDLDDDFDDEDDNEDW